MNKFSLQLNRRNNAYEVPVNTGLAAALLRDKLAGIKIMLDAGVPKQVIKLVLRGSRNARRCTDSSVF